MTTKNSTNLERDINKFYRVLAEVYVFGLACHDCILKDRGICSQNINTCAKRLKLTMGELMNAR